MLPLAGDGGRGEMALGGLTVAGSLAAHRGASRLGNQNFGR
ncbi:hypothetical protein ACFSHQ_12635 [Gemmobacter lanyuensis]